MLCHPSYACPALDRIPLSQPSARMKHTTLVLRCLLVAGVIGAAVLIFHQINMATRTQGTRSFRRARGYHEPEFSPDAHQSSLRSLRYLPHRMPELGGARHSVSTTMSCPTYAGPGFSKAAATFEPSEGAGPQMLVVDGFVRVFIL